MRKGIFFLLIAVLFIFPSLASAQAGISIKSVNISLWPEYDRAEMLVIEYIILSSQVTLPTQIQVRIPAAAVLHTVAIGADRDTVTDQGVEYSTDTRGDWQILSITASAPAIQVEYYDPSLARKDALRSYTYQWQSDYPVADFLVLFQQPFEASDFKSTLDLQDDGVHSDGMQYYFSSLGSIPAGKLLTFDLSYQRSIEDLSVSRLEIQPVVVDENTPGRVSLNNYLPYLIGGLGIILIAGGVLYYRQSGRTTSKKSRRRHSEHQEEGAVTYCAQCGTRARSGDRFCRTCGARIRQSE